MMYTLRYLNILTFLSQLQKKKHLKTKNKWLVINDVHLKDI